MTNTHFSLYCEKMSQRLARHPPRYCRVLRDGELEHSRSGQLASDLLKLGALRCARRKEEHSINPAHLPGASLECHAISRGGKVVL